MFIRQNSVKRGFTLIELLVVIAIIAILAAILFPVFARARENARKSSCQNNVKNVVLAFKQYIDNNDERYPLIGVTSAVGPTPPYGWADALQPYLKNDQIFQCPSDANEAGANPQTLGYTDYYYNANFVLWTTATSSARGANESVFGSTAQTIILGDGGYTNGTTPTGNSRYMWCADGTTTASEPTLPYAGAVCGTAGSSTNAVLPGSTANSFPSVIHLDGANYGFADGHVKWFKASTANGQSAQIKGNGETQATIGGNATFSLLNKLS
jgi:prepilin-type N-terminal cleavage/methylation domain-containing protein/prepilin-type processing-associated H-X9-DG protein